MFDLKLRAILLGDANRLCFDFWSTSSLPLPITADLGQTLGPLWWLSTAHWAPAALRSSPFAGAGGCSVHAGGMPLRRRLYFLRSGRWAHPREGDLWNPSGGLPGLPHYRPHVGWLHIYAILCQTLHGTAIYAYIDPPKPPQLVCIYGIHGVSGSRLMFARRHDAAKVAFSQRVARCGCAALAQLSISAV